MKVFIIVKRVTHGELEQIDNIRVFAEYRKAIMWINEQKTDYKTEYDIDELEVQND
jgi:hypothetical protein